MTLPCRAVLFDLDGTLVDSWRVHVRCLRRAVTSLGLPRLTLARITAAQRATDLETLATIVGADAASAALDVYHRALLADLAAAPVEAMPGAEDVINSLARQGVIMGVCTGRSRAGATALLCSSGLEITLLTSREDAQRPKPAADGLQVALEKVATVAADAIWVGDTAADAKQGEHAGVRTVIVSRRSPAGSMGRAGVIRGLHELESWIMGVSA